MVGRAEAAQLHALAVFNLLGVRVAPFDGHVAVGVGVHEHVEGAAAAELRQKRDGRGDLAKDGGDFGLDLLLRLFRLGGGRGRGGVLLVGAGPGSGGGLGLFGGGGNVDVELPALDVLARVLVGDDDDEARDFAADHPLVELGHDFLDVGFYLVVGRDWEGLLARRVGDRGRGGAGNAPSMLRPYFLTLVIVSWVVCRMISIFLRCKVFGWVDASLESVRRQLRSLGYGLGRVAQDSMDRVLELPHR